MDSHMICRESLSGKQASATGLHIAEVTFVCSYCSTSPWLEKSAEILLETELAGPGSLQSLGSGWETLALSPFPSQVTLPRV